MAEQQESTDGLFSFGGKKKKEDQTASGSTFKTDAPSADSDRYSMKSKNRGTAIIINMMEYAPHLGLNERPTSEEDENNLTEMFKSWGLTVQAERNKSIAEISRIFHKASGLDHGDCFVGVILTHGTDGDQVYAYDGLFNLSGIFDKFKGDKCPTLAGKPKIFLIQACRGDKTDAGVALTLQTEQADSPGSDNKVVPIEADFFYVYSTAPGYFAFKSSGGSWFVSSMRAVFDKYGSDQELNQMMLRTNRYVCDKMSSANDATLHEKMQTLHIQSTLRKELYFTQ